MHVISLMIPNVVLNITDIFQATYSLACLNFAWYFLLDKILFSTMSFHLCYFSSLFLLKSHLSHYCISKVQHHNCTYKHTVLCICKYMVHWLTYKSLFYHWCFLAISISYLTVSCKYPSGQKRAKEVSYY
jgi:hypothetical protein